MARKKQKKLQAKVMKSKNDDAQIVTEVTKMVDSSDRYLDSGYTDRFIREYKLYRSNIPANTFPTKSRIFNPLVFSIIETQAAKYVAKKPVGEWKPSNANATGDPEKIQLAFDKWYREEKMVMKSQDASKKTAIYGSSASQVYWKFKQGYKMGKPYAEVNRPSVRLLRLEDKMFGFDFEADSFADCRWAFVRYPMSKKQLEDIKASPSAGMYTNLDKAIKDFESADGYTEKGMMEDRDEVNDRSTQKEDSIKKAECIYLENYETGERITVIGRKHVIMNRKNPYLFNRSLLLTNNVRVPSETMGMSDIEPIESMAHGANLFRNMRADNIDQVLHPKHVISTMAEIDEEEVIDEDSLIIRSNDVNGIKPLIIANVTDNAYREDEAIKNDIYAATSITPFSMGNDNDVEGDRSGKAIGKLQDAANSRIKNKMANFEIDYIKEIAEKWQRLMAQYQTENIEVEDAGETIIITPQDLGAPEVEGGEYGEWDYFVETGSTQMEDTEASREDFIVFQTKLIELASMKRAEEKENIDASMPQPQPEPQVDPQTGQPMPAPPVPETPQPAAPVLDYDKLVETLAEKFGIKNWREMWLVAEQEEEMPSLESEMLPSIDDEEEMVPEEQGQPQEMLPSIDDEEQAPQERGEMLPSIEDEQEPMASIIDDEDIQAPQGGEMLPSVDDYQPQQITPPQGAQQASGEMLPSVEDDGLMGKLKGFFKPKKGKKTKKGKKAKKK